SSASVIVWFLGESFTGVEGEAEDAGPFRGGRFERAARGTGHLARAKPREIDERRHGDEHGPATVPRGHRVATSARRNAEVAHFPEDLRADDDAVFVPGDGDGEREEPESEARIHPNQR